MGLPLENADYLHRAAFCDSSEDWRGALRPRESLLCMRVALEVWSTSYTRVEATCVLAESLGFDALYYGESPHNLNLECWTTLAGLARATDRIRLGPVLANVLPGYRSSLLLARQAATVDRISGGRVDFRTGVGAAAKFGRSWWNPHGIDYPDYDQRLADLEAALDVFGDHRGGSADHGSPIHGMIPLTIAARGERSMRLAATRADVWETSFCTPKEFTGQQERMADLGESDTLVRSLEIDGFTSCTQGGVDRLLERVRSERGGSEDLAPVFERALVGTPDGIADRLHQLKSVGVDQVVVALHDPHDADAIEALAEATTRLRDA
jgi:alkanesulfonate monooxygenase SsuD/methylene tetrahydromethanopterin reductase-like flavin-dependent oxidoreductase (luciferase family)